jgi:hypothetical protein
MHHQRAATVDGWERARLKALAPTMTESHLKELLRSRRYGHVLPSRVQAKLVAWDQLKYYASFVPGAKANESDLKIDYPGGHRVQLFGADSPDSFRGAPFSGISYDEFSQHPPNIFSEVTSKSLADHLGYAIFAGTIIGKNQLYRTYEAAKGSPEWFALWQDVSGSLATEGPEVTLTLRQAMHDDQQLIAKGLMTQEEYDQEWFLSTEAAIKGNYYGGVMAVARKEGRIRRVPYDPGLKVHDVWDLGKGPNMAVGLFQRAPGREMRMIEYLEGAESDGIPQMIAVLQRKPYVFGKHFAPHDIKATELGTGKTRLEMADRLGWHFTIVPDIGLAEGITALRTMFARLYIDETLCKDFLEAIVQYRRQWFVKLGVYGNEPVHDWTSHGADMARYAAVAEDLMTNDKPRRHTSTPPPTNRDVASLGWMG